MEAYRNIVCATDFSEHCRVAAERATDLARCYRAPLTLVHIMEYFPEDRSNLEIAPEDVDPLAHREERARAALAKLAQQLGYDKLTQELRVSTHSAKYELIRFIEERGADLIVVASHGHHGVSSTLGSTAYGVTHSAPCDVLSVRAR